MATDVNLDDFLQRRRANMAELRDSLQFANGLNSFPVDIRSEFVRPSAVRERVMGHEFNVLALVKGAEQFVFVYDDTSRDQLVDAIRELAADPESSLSWFDAVVLTNKANEQSTEFLAADEWP